MADILQLKDVSLERSIDSLLDQAEHLGVPMVVLYKKDGVESAPATDNAGDVWPELYQEEAE